MLQRESNRMSFHAKEISLGYGFMNEKKTEYPQKKKGKREEKNSKLKNARIQKFLVTPTPFTLIKNEFYGCPV